MSARENKAIVQRAEDLWNTGNLAIADEIHATDFVNHDPGDPDVRDLDTYKGFIAGSAPASLTSVSPLRT